MPRLPRSKSVDSGTFIVVFVAVDDTATANAYRSQCERRGLPFHYVDGGVGIKGKPPRVPVGTLPVMVIVENLGTLREWYKGARQLPWEALVEGGVGEVQSGIAAPSSRIFDVAFQIYAQTLEASLTATSGR